MASLLTYTRFRSFKSDGVTPNAAGHVHIYLNGTTTNVGVGAALDGRSGSDVANPLTLDSIGEADLYLAEGAQYTIKIDDSDNAQISSKDDISCTDLENWITAGSNISFSAGNVGVGGAAGSENLKVTGSAKVTGTLEVGGALTVTGPMAAGLGVGLARTEGTLHVHTASAGSVTADTARDDLVVENDADVGITLLSPNGFNSGIVFGSPTDNLAAKIIYTPTLTRMTVGTAIASGFIEFDVANGDTVVVIDANGKTTFDGSDGTSASITLPHGSAPSSPVNGDMWTTTAGLYIQINGGTVGPLS